MITAIKETENEKEVILPPGCKTIGRELYETGQIRKPVMFPKP